MSSTPVYTTRSSTAQTGVEEPPTPLEVAEGPGPLERALHSERDKNRKARAEAARLRERHRAMRSAVLTAGNLLLTAAKQDRADGDRGDRHE